MADEQRFQLLVAGVSDYAIYMLSPEGYVSSWNAGAQRFKGYLPHEIIGKHFSLFYTADDQAAGIPNVALKTAFEHGKFEAEGWRVRKDGSRFWASVVIDRIHDAKGNFIGFAKVTRDITERKIAQEALRESEERFRLLVQGVTDYAIYMLSPMGIITNWNSGAQRIKGYTQEEVVGTHFSRFFDAESRAKGIPEKSLEIAAKEGRYEHEGWRIRKDGSRFWAHVVVDAIHNDMGQLLGFAKITRDITERKAAADALEKANAALFQAQKMEAIGQLTGGIAHDFNNLLSVLSSSLDLLSTRLTNHADLKMLQSMQNAVMRGATLTQQLLSFARQQPLKVEKYDLNDLISGFESVLRRAGNANITFDITPGPQLRCVMMDAARFESSLLNLVVNARDALPDGGKITVATENVNLQENEVGNLAAGSYVKVSVSDTGTGMPPEVASRIFEPFFTTKDVGKGTGLGLSQVYGFVTQSGGDLSLQTAVGKGTTIGMYFPALENEAEHADAGVGADMDADTVLVVEDEQNLMDVASELFRSLGYEVITASNGAEAAEVMSRRQDIDVLFADVMMPNGMSGIELARLTRKNYPGIKIILVSGYALPALKAEHGNVDEFTFINKPYRLAEVAKKLRAAT